MTLSPDQDIAKHAFEVFHQTNYPHLSADSAFELYATHLVTKTEGVSSESVRKSIVGSANDGGIDAFLILLNKTELVDSNSPRLSARKNALDGLQKNVPLDIVVVQSKNSPVWDSEALPKVRDVLDMIMDDKVSVEQLRAFPLNDDVVAAALTYRKIQKKLVTRTPTLTFRVHYVAFAKRTQLTDYRNTKKKILDKALKARLPQRAKVIVEYVGAERMNELDAQTTDFDVPLSFAKAPVRDGKALIGLVKIRDYAKFLRRPGSDAIREEMFSVNVRDFAGKTARVNSAISRTLEQDDDSTFWWLNNGITIIADETSDPTELGWVLTNPLIVNGLQTSNVIHAASVEKKITKKRAAQSLLVRIIKEPNAAVRESVIIGTNNQTTVNSLQLHANDPLQVKLERYLRSKDWYYERRRYQYRGSSVPTGKIRSLTELGQAVMAIHLLAPDTARARPATQLSSTAGFEKVFNSAYPELLYLKALQVMRAVEEYLQTPSGLAHPDTATNARYYLASGYVILALKLKNLESYSAAVSVQQIKLTSVDSRLSKVHAALDAAVAKLDNGKIARDQIFKGAELKKDFFSRLVSMNS